jgi:hypothetical protein
MALRLLEERALAGVHLEGLDLCDGHGAAWTSIFVLPRRSTMAIGS